jgi:hypothetical protein
VAALAKALAGHQELQDRFLPPEIRLLLENPARERTEP